MSDFPTLSSARPPAPHWRSQESFERDALRAMGYIPDEPEERLSGAEFAARGILIFVLVGFLGFLLVGGVIGGSGALAEPPEPKSMQAMEAPALVVGAGDVIVIPTRSIPTPPAGQPLNDLVLAQISEYPSDGRFDSDWRGPNWHGASGGTTRDIVYRGEVVALSDRRHTHCCGLTFEVAIKALTRAYGGPVPGLTALDVYRMRLGFCGDDKAYAPERLVVDALQRQGLGSPVSFDDARPGDFVQFWRRDGSGHSAVFMGWESTAGEIVGVRYWSTQASTHGVGFLTETFAGYHGINRKRLYLVRLHAPDERKREERSQMTLPFKQWAFSASWRRPGRVEICHGELIETITPEDARRQGAALLAAANKAEGAARTRRDP